MADNDGDLDEARTLRPLQAAACTYRVAFGPRAGRKVLTLQGKMPREPAFKQDLCADILEAPVIERILTHLGLQARTPPRAAALGQTLLQAA